MNLIREILNKIEEEHQAKIRQLDSIKVQQDSFFTDQQQQQVNGTGDQKSFDPFKLNDTPANNNGDKTTVNSHGPLSLDEKERLAFEKEQSERLKMNEQHTMLWMGGNVSAQNSEPLKSSQNSKPLPTKDLTDLLINSNLNLMSKPSTQSFPTNGQLSNVFSSFPAHQFNQQPPSQQQQKPNYSALDNISIPNIGSKSTPQTLNSMKQSTINHHHHTQSLSPIRTMKTMNTVQSNIQSSKSTKQLSKSELEEFLN